IENIFQKHACAFFRRKRRDEVFDRDVDVPANRLSRRDGVRSLCHCFRRFADAATTQEVDAEIMSNAEQPRFEWAAGVEHTDLLISLKQRILNQIFSVHYRTCHARTISVETRPNICCSLDECEVTFIEQAHIL